MKLDRFAVVAACIELPGSDQRSSLVLKEIGPGIEPFTRLNSGFYYQKAQLVHTLIE